MGGRRGWNSAKVSSINKQGVFIKGEGVQQKYVDTNNFLLFK